MSICRCSQCSDKRAKFKGVVQTMSEGHGISRKKIARNVNEIPENFIDDMKTLLKRMRQEGNAKFLTPKQLQFFKVYKRILRDFIRPSSRSLMATKRHFDAKNVPFSEAFAKVYLEQPAAFEHILNRMSFHG